MSITPGSVEHLSKIISHVVTPAFLLGAMASFVSILTNRMSGLQDRIREVGKTEHPVERLPQSPGSPVSDQGQSGACLSVSWPCRSRPAAAAR